MSSLLEWTIVWYGTNLKKEISATHNTYKDQERNINTIFESDDILTRYEVIYKVCETKNM